jgi:hypothetical protein
MCNNSRCPSYPGFPMHPETSKWRRKSIRNPDFGMRTTNAGEKDLLQAACPVDMLLRNAEDSTHVRHSPGNSTRCAPRAR